MPDSAAATPAHADATDEARSALIAALVAEGNAPDAIHVGSSPGPLDTTRLQTRVDGAYPGAGLKTAIIADGRHYGGEAGGADLAELARARGWFDALPDAAELAALATFGWRPGMAIDSDVTAQIVRDEVALTLTYGAREAMSGDRSRVVVTLPRRGPAALVMTSAEPTAPPEPSDPLVALEQALTGGDALRMLSALQRLDTASNPTRDALLARCAVLPNETLAFDAIMRLGASDDAAARLRAQAITLDADARALLIKRAGEAHGEAFARRVTP